MKAEEESCSSCDCPICGLSDLRNTHQRGDPDCLQKNLQTFKELVLWEYTFDSSGMKAYVANNHKSFIDEHKKFDFADNDMATKHQDKKLKECLKIMVDEIVEVTKKCIRTVTQENYDIVTFYIGKIDNGRPVSYSQNQYVNYIEEADYKNYKNRHFAYKFRMDPPAEITECFSQYKNKKEPYPEGYNLNLGDPHCSKFKSMFLHQLILDQERQVYHHDHDQQKNERAPLFCCLSKSYLDSTLESKGNTFFLLKTSLSTSIEFKTPYCFGDKVGIVFYHESDDDYPAIALSASKPVDPLDKAFFGSYGENSQEYVLRAGLTFRRYDAPIDPTTQQPNPAAYYGTIKQKFNVLTGMTFDPSDDFVKDIIWLAPVTKYPNSMGHTVPFHLINDQQNPTFEGEFA